VDVSVSEVDGHGAPLPPSTRMVLRPGGDARSPARAGADIHRLRAALAAEGLASAWIDDGTPLGLIAIGMPA